MTSYIVLECPLPKLDMATVTLPRARQILQTGQTMLWNRQGQIRMIPTSILEDLVRNYEDGMAALENSPLAELLEHAHCVYWEQTEPLDASENRRNPPAGQANA